MWSTSVFLECRNASDWTVGKPAYFVGKNDFSRTFAGFYAGHPALLPRTPGSFDLMRMRSSLAPFPKRGSRHYCSFIEGIELALCNENGFLIKNKGKSPFKNILVSVGGSVILVGSCRQPVT